MNAHLPVVRRLLCYARRGATSMHQRGNSAEHSNTTIDVTRGTQQVPARNTTHHGALQPHTTPHNVNSTTNRNAAQPHTTTTTQPNRTRHATTHHTTQRLHNMPQGSTRQQPAIHNNFTQHETPQPNKNYTTPGNTTQYYTTQETATKRHTTGHGKANARHNTTPRDATRHNTKHAATRRNDATTRRHTTKYHPTRHNTMTRLHDAAPRHQPKTRCRNPPRYDRTQRTT